MNATYKDRESMIWILPKSRSRTGPVKRSKNQISSSDLILGSWSLDNEVTVMNSKCTFTLYYYDMISMIPSSEKNDKIQEFETFTSTYDTCSLRSYFTTPTYHIILGHCTYAYEMSYLCILLMYLSASCSRTNKILRSITTV